MAELTFLGVDIGGTKTAWGTFDHRGTLLESGIIPTPKEREPLLATLMAIVEDHPADGIGIGIAGTVSHKGETRVCTNMPFMNYYPLLEYLRTDKIDVPMVLDNDARCALIGEVWLGAAKKERNVVMLTLGTGVGGAVMQKGMVLHHPEDVQDEISRLMVDPGNPFPGTTGAGTVEALIGGRSIEERFGVKLSELAEDGHAGKAEAMELWKIISYYFHQSIQVIYNVYSCNKIIIGGHGVKDIDLYLGDQKPVCPVIPAKLGSQANLYGCGRIAIDVYQEAKEEWE